MNDRFSASDWDDLRVLLEVVRKGSFLAAATELRLAVSTVARRIALLEKRLGSVLLERRASGAHATPAGRSMAALAERIELDILATLRSAVSVDNGLAGTIKLSVGDGFTQLMMDCVAAFAARHPSVSFEFMVDSRAADLRRHEADVAIRTTHKQEPSLVYRRLGQLEYALWAAPSYLAQQGAPASVEGLAVHRFVTFAAPLDRHLTVEWLHELGAKQFAIRTSSFRSQLAAIRSGMGIGALPRGAAAGLTEVLPGVSPKTMLPLYLVSHPQALRRPEVRAFADRIVADVGSRLDRTRTAFSLPENGFASE